MNDPYIKARSFAKFDASRVPSPCFVVDECAIEHNLRILRRVQEESGAKILSALKAFSMFELAPLVSRYLSGTCSSGLNEATLAREFYQGEIHVYSAAFKAQELSEIAEFSDHIVLNSFSQWQRFKPLLNEKKSNRPKLSFGLRINPQHSEGDVPLYDPCAPCSRLGIPLSQFEGQNLEGISGLHFHTLCEQGLEPLRCTLAAVEEKFAYILKEMEWINFGGGHHISDTNYDVDGLIQLIRRFAKKYKVQVYMEPGETIAIQSGVLVTEVLDLSWNDGDFAIVDTSATCHMPDTLEMPYRAHIIHSGQAQEKKHHYRLGSTTCLAGDIMGEYSFDTPLKLGQRLMFDDMSHYTMVKTTTFNGIGLPAIAVWNSESDKLRIIKQFSYQDFKERLS